MMKPTLKWLNTAATMVLILAISGCQTGAIKHHYPLWPVPEKPAIVFSGAEPAGQERVNCLADHDLRRLNSYIISLNGTIKKYERQIGIINGE